MRRPVILLVIFGLVELVRPLGSTGYGAQALLTFGFLLLAAYTVGEIAAASGIPAIVGYMAAGAAFGPWGLASVSREAVARLVPVSDLAIALIAFLAGAELQWREVRERGVALLKIVGTELLLGALLLGAALYLAHDLVPFLRPLPQADLAAVVILFASVAVVHSPAVTMALLTDTGARGPVARTTLGVVLVTDVIVVLLFTVAVTVARSLVPAAGAGPSFGVVAWEILGALLVGGALGGAAALYLRFVGEELFLFALLFTLLGAEVAHLAHVETLLTLLVAGFIAENVSPRGAGEALRRAMERSAAPVFVVFFALSGAQMDLSAVLRFLPVLVLLALVRAGALLGGTRLGARWAGVGGDERRLLWLGLVSQAGVAIGLASVLAGVFPTFGVELRTLLLAFIALNQLAGPVLFRRALVEAGEIRPGPAVVPVAADE